MTTSMFAAIVCASARLPSNDARRTNALRRGSTRWTRSIGIDDDEVADRDVGADVPHPQRLGVEIDEHRAPSTVEPADPPGEVRSGGHPTVGGPPESIVAWLTDAPTVPSGAIRDAQRGCARLESRDGAGATRRRPARRRRRRTPRPGRAAGWRRRHGTTNRASPPASSARGRPVAAASGRGSNRLTRRSFRSLETASRCRRCSIHRGGPHQVHSCGSRSVLPRPWLRAAPSRLDDRHTRRAGEATRDRLHGSIRGVDWELSGGDRHRRRDRDPPLCRGRHRALYVGSASRRRTLSHARSRDAQSEHRRAPGSDLQRRSESSSF